MLVSFDVTRIINSHIEVGSGGPENSHCRKPRFPSLQKGMNIRVTPFPLCMYKIFHDFFGYLSVINSLERSDHRKMGRMA